MARVETLLLCLELDAVMLVSLLLLLTKQQVHGKLQLINLIDGHLCLGGLLLVLSTILNRGLAVGLVLVLMSGQSVDSIGKEVGSTLTSALAAKHLGWTGVLAAARRNIALISRWTEEGGA